MNKSALRCALTSAIILSLSGCNIDQTEEGEMPDADVNVESGQMPEYEVVQTQEGELPDVEADFESGSLPEYDIQWADVDVGTTEEKVTVPKVRVVMEEETVSVPVIDINMPDDENGEKERRTLTLEADVAHAGHDLTITHVYALEERLLVIGELTENETPEQMEEVSVSDQLILKAPDLNVRYVITGKQPENLGRSDVRYVQSLDELTFDFDEAVTIYERS